MKNVDEQIREIFSQKLGNVEADVSPELWNAVQSQLPGAGASVAGGVAKYISAKIIIAAVVVVAVVTSVIYVVNVESKAKTIVTTPVTIVEENLAMPEMVPAEELKTVVEGDQSKEIRSKGIRVVESQSKVQIGTEKSAFKKQETRLEMPLKKSEVLSAKPENVTAIIEEELKTATQVSTAQVPTPVTVEIKGDFTILPLDMEEMRYSFTSHDDEATYQWNFGDASFSQEKNASHTYENEGEFTVTLTVVGKSGVIKSSSHNLTVFKPGKLLIPNIFTPNGDGSNDTFDLRSGSEGIIVNSIEIKNDRGVTVFKSDGSAMWEGVENNGNVCPSGTYQYFISAIDRNHEVYKKMGNVVLIR